MSTPFRRIFILNTVLCLSLSVLGGCGYQFQGSTSILPPDVKKIAIARVENDTTYSSVGYKLEEELRSQFERYGVVEVVDETRLADAVLYAKITNVDTRVRNVTSETDVAIDQELFMTVAAELRRKNGQTLYRDSNILTTESFASVADTVVTSSSSFAQGNINADTLGSLGQREVSRGQEEQTLDTLVEETARKVYLNAVAAGF
jgi:outer membrane lipopolysaccharide assembly protein LptE/RlpB